MNWKAYILQLSRLFDMPTGSDMELSQKETLLDEMQILCGISNGAVSIFQKRLENIAKAMPGYAEAKASHNDKLNAIYSLALEKLRDSFEALEIM